MKLHEDKNAFRVLLEHIHMRTGYRTDVLEKDYYVVLMLHELAEKQKAGLPAYFKGGTALYKALKTTNRFSEDIDLSVDTRGCSRSQNDRRLEQSAKKYTSLDRDASAGRTNRSEVISIFTYEPVTAYDAGDALQRFGKLKIEATSFTISDPTASLEIAPMLYDLASESEQKILREQYDVAPFPIMTITTERIFIEEEAGRLDGIPGVMPGEFTFFETAPSNNAVRNAYAVMQAQYVLRPEDRIEYDSATAGLREIRDKLMQSRAWSLYQPSENLQHRIRQQDDKRISPTISPRKRRNDMER